MKRILFVFEGSAISFSRLEPDCVAAIRQIRNEAGIIMFNVNKLLILLVYKINNKRKI